MICDTTTPTIVYIQYLTKPESTWKDLVPSSPWHLDVVHKLTQLQQDAGQLRMALSVNLYLCPMQLLLSYSATDSNLQGDLGNTPLILACSINNFEALSILVCTQD